MSIVNSVENEAPLHHFLLVRPVTSCDQLEPILQILHGENFSTHTVPVRLDSY